MDAEATRRVLVTRPEEQAVAWVERLGRHGVPAEALPLLSIEAVEDGSGLAAAWAGLPAYRLRELNFAGPLLNVLDDKAYDGWQDIGLQPYQAVWLCKDE